MPFDIAGALGAGYSPDEITSFLQSNPKQSTMDVSGALKAGYSPAEIVDHLNPQNPAGRFGTAQGVPILAPIARGGAQAQAAIANLAEDLGFHGAAHSLRSTVNQEDLTTPTSAGGLVQDLKDGSYGKAIAALPSAVLEGAAPAAATIAAGVAGGPVAGLGAAAGIGALTQGDAIARARAANNGRQAPSGSDLALGTLGAAGVGALGSVGLPGLAGNVAGGGLKAALLASATHATADALQPQETALAGSVGTQSGAEAAPVADSAAAALTGFATRGALAAGQGASSLTPASKTAGLADEYAGMTPEQQRQVQNVAAAGQALKQTGDDAVPLPSETRAAATARTTVDDLSTKFKSLIAARTDQGLLGDDDQATATAALNAAKNQQRTLTQGHLDDIAGLGLGDDDTKAAQDALTQIAALSDAGVAARNSGPLQRAGSLAGRLASYVGGEHLEIGFGPAMIAGHIGSAIGSNIGSKLDAMLGTSSPALVKQASQAVSMLNAAGVPVPDTRAQLDSMVGTQRDALDQQRTLLGLNDGTRDAAMAEATARAQASAALNKSQAQASAAYGSAAERDQGAVDKSQAQAAALKQQQMDAMAAQQQADMKLAAQKQAQVDAAYQSQQPNYDAAFADMEKRNPIADQQNEAAVRSNTQSQVAAYLTENAQRQAMKDRGTNLLEAQGGKVAMMAYRMAQARSEAMAPPPPPQARFPVDPGQTPQRLPPGASTGVPRTMQAPTAASPAQAAPTPAPTLAPDTAGLPPAALAQAQRLPQWKYGLGAALEDALVKSGQARPVNMAGEVGDALKTLQSKGHLPADIATALQGHDGRVVPLIYNLIRNEMLMRNGVNRLAQ